MKQRRLHDTFTTKETIGYTTHFSRDYGYCSYVCSLTFFIVSSPQGKDWRCANIQTAWNTNKMSLYYSANLTTFSVYCNL